MLTILFAVLGLVFGSFGNVVIARLPAGETLRGRSHCPLCGRTLRAGELVPLFSFLLLEGRCSGCKGKISWQYPLVEAASGLLFVFAALRYPADLFAAATVAAAFWSLLLIAAIDARTQSIPDVLTLLLGVCGLLLHLHFGDFGVIAALIGLVFFGAQWVLSRGKWVGSGDVFLAIAMGIFLSSWQLMLFALFSSYILGAAVVTTLLLLKRVKVTQSIAFGPFLVLGTIVAFVWGNELIGMLF